MNAGGQDYLSLTSLAARQAFGAIEYTNTPTEPLLFMKEISSDGNVNTVDGKSIGYCNSHQHFSPPQFTTLAVSVVSVSKMRQEG